MHVNLVFRKKLSSDLVDGFPMFFREPVLILEEEGGKIGLDTSRTRFRPLQWHPFEGRGGPPPFFKGQGVQG